MKNKITAILIIALVAVMTTSCSDKQVPVNEVRKCQDLFLEKMRSSHPEIIEMLGNGKIDDDATNVIKSVMADIAGQFK